MSKSKIKRIKAQERPDIENDELPTHFICDECGYEGNEDDLIEESVKGGMNYYCPQCQSPDISWKD